MQHERAQPGVVSQAMLIAGKDLEIEWRSRVATARVVPFAGIIVVLFAIALDPDRGLLPRLAPGLFWVTAILASLLAIGRSFAVERDNRAGLGLLLSGADPTAMYLGKTIALAVELVALEAVVGLVMVALYDVTPRQPVLLGAGVVLATAGVSAAGTLYGGAVAADRGRDSLLALLLLPVLVPVLLGATRLFETALLGGDDAALWLGLLAAFAALYAGLGALAFGPLLQES